MELTEKSYTTWVAGLHRRHGWLQLSPERAYMHAEEEYNSHYGNEPADPREGEGLCTLLRNAGVDLGGPALEIGCGTGHLSYGIAQHYPGPDFLITDPSPTFLRLTQEQFKPDFAGTCRRHFAVFNADDVDQLPEQMFSVIALRSTLHHILDVEGFIRGAARALAPGGALVMGAEPCESGYLLMAAVAQSIPAAFKAAGIEMRPEWTYTLNDFTETVKFCCNRDIDKTYAEDKHFFTPHELGEQGARHGLGLKFLPNASFREFAPPHVASFRCFSNFFLTYLRACMRGTPEFVDHIRVHLKDQLKFIDDCYRVHPGPAITGIYLCRKS